MHFAWFLTQHRLNNRRRAGVSIAELPLALFLLLFVGFFPCCNAIGFCCAYLSLQSLTGESVNAVATSETVTGAQKRSQELIKNFKNPFLTSMQPMQFDDGSAQKESADKDSRYCKLMLLVGEDNQHMKSFMPLDVPKYLRPDYKDNSTKLIYMYRLTICGKVAPIINLSAVPVVGQLPLIGAPCNMELSAEAPVEDLHALGQ